MLCRTSVLGRRQVLDKSHQTAAKCWIHGIRTRTVARAHARTSPSRSPSSSFTSRKKNRLLLGANAVSLACLSVNNPYVNLPERLATVR
jgi:hypothetical protein